LNDGSRNYHAKLAIVLTTISGGTSFANIWANIFVEGKLILIHQFDAEKLIAPIKYIFLLYATRRRAARNHRYLNI